MLVILTNFNDFFYKIVKIALIVMDILIDVTYIILEIHVF